MEPYVEPPPETKKEKEEQVIFYPTAIGEDRGKGEFPIRKAIVSDVKQILELVNGFAASNLMLPRGPQYLYENVRDFVVAVERTYCEEGKSESSREGVVACGSLHVLWEDMAEVRSVAIHPDYQNRGLGKLIVEYMKQDAKGLGVKTLFTFTLAEPFFKSLGFERKGKKELPPKVWGECSRCPKYFKCDEVGMILEI